MKSRNCWLSRSVVVMGMVVVGATNAGSSTQFSSGVARVGVGAIRSPSTVSYLAIQRYAVIRTISIRSQNSSKVSDLVTDVTRSVLRPGAAILTPGIVARLPECDTTFLKLLTRDL